MDFKERYRMVRPLARGSVSEVFLAFDEKLCIHRVIKTVVCGEGPDMERRRQQIIGELLLLKDLDHPCLPHITDFDVEASFVKIVMDYIEGPTLKDYIEQNGPVDEELAIEWGLELTDLFLYLHGRKNPVFHRDLKPSNIILHPSGRLILLDFGIACQGSAGNYLAEGTPGYAAPEQYRNCGPLDERADIYSLGRTISYCLNGNQLPSDAFQNLHETKQSRRMRDFLDSCMNEDIGRRYANMSMVRKDLIGLRQRRRGGWHIVSRHFIIWIIPLITISLLALSICLWLNQESRRKEALYYVQCAQETMDSDQSLSFYEKALKQAPQEERIYESICQDWIRNNHFSDRQASQLLNVLESSHALSFLEVRRPSVYASFSYEMGIAFFFDMAGSTGKEEAVIWFERSLDHGEYLQESQRKRGGIYQQIGEYYHGLLSYGQDPSGEKGEAAYKDFFLLLHQLNEDCRRNGETKADQVAAYMAGREITEEIYLHCQEFQEEGIPLQDLQEELKQVETLCGQYMNDIEQKQKDQLLAMLERAERRIHIMEDNHET